MHERHLQAVQAELGAVLRGQDAGGAVVIRVDVGDEQSADPGALAADGADRATNRVDRCG